MAFHGEENPFSEAENVKRPDADAFSMLKKYVKPM